MITARELDEIAGRANLALEVSDTLCRTDAHSMLKLIAEVKNLQNLLRLSIKPQKGITVGNMIEWKDAVLAALPPE